MDELDAPEPIYARRIILRASWREFSVEVRVLSGALRKACYGGEVAVSSTVKELVAGSDVGGTHRRHGVRRVRLLSETEVRERAVVVSEQGEPRHPAGWSLPPKPAQ